MNDYDCGYDEEDVREAYEADRILYCKRCGSVDVRWRQQGGRWVLFSLRPGVVHECGQATADDFK